MRTRSGQGFVAPNVEPVPLKRKASHADVLDQPGDPVARRVALATLLEISIEVPFEPRWHEIERDGGEFRLRIHGLFAKADHPMVVPKRDFVVG